MGDRSKLLTEDDSLTPEFETVLEYIFRGYATPSNRVDPPLDRNVPASQRTARNREQFKDVHIDQLCLKTDDIQLFTWDTNGVDLPATALEETRALSCTPEGWLLFIGFTQLYQLQTTNDIAETWKDLAKHGYNEALEFVDGTCNGCMLVRGTLGNDQDLIVKGYCVIPASRLFSLVQGIHDSNDDGSCAEINDVDVSLMCVLKSTTHARKACSFNLSGAQVMTSQAKSYNPKSAGVKRLLREAQMLSSLDNASEIHAAPLENDLYDWHFTIRGVSNSEFEGGVYHGRILLPLEYPYKPPDIMLLTPNGRFELNRKICLSITGYHEETWQPSWDIRTALVGLIAFFTTEGKGAIGSIDAPAAERKRLASRSGDWMCPTCKVKNNELLPPLPSSSDASTARDEAVQDETKVVQGDKKADDVALPPPEQVDRGADNTLPVTEAEPLQTSDEAETQPEPSHPKTPQSAPTPTTGERPEEVIMSTFRTRPEAQVQAPKWLDGLIGLLLCCILAMVVRKLGRGVQFGREATNLSLVDSE